MSTEHERREEWLSLPRCRAHGVRECEQCEADEAAVHDAERYHSPLALSDSMQELLDELGACPECGAHPDLIHSTECSHWVDPMAGDER